MTLIYKLDFETGAFPPEVYVEEARPNGFKCDIVSDIVRGGNYACRCSAEYGELAGRAMVTLIFLRDQSIKEAYYGFSIYLPSSFRMPAPEHVIIFEIMQRTLAQPYQWRILTGLKAKLYSNQPPEHPPHLVLCTNGQGPYEEPWTDTEDLPLGRWIDFVLYLNVDENGKVKLWQDGELKADLSYDTRCYSDPPAPYPSYGYYPSEGSPPNWVVVDQLVVASTFVEATPTPTSPLLSIASTPITGTTFHLDSVPYVTPFSEEINEGDYLVDMPANTMVGWVNYIFKEWQDGLTSSVREINLVTPMSLTAMYEVPPPLPSEKGKLDIHAYYRTKEVEADFSIEGTGIIGVTPQTVELDPTTYHITATYGRETETVEVGVVSTQTVKVEIHFLRPVLTFPVLRGCLPRAATLVDRRKQVSLIRGYVSRLLGRG